MTFDRTEAVLFDLDGTLIDSAPDYGPDAVADRFDEIAAFLGGRP